MPRLPVSGNDVNTWGDILNDFLATEHNADGSQKPLPQSKITNLTSNLAAKEDKSAKGAANGYAPLDSSSKVPVANLPASSGGANVAAQLYAYPSGSVSLLIADSSPVNLLTPIDTIDETYVPVEDGGDLVELDQATHKLHIKQDCIMWAGLSATWDNPGSGARLNVEIRSDNSAGFFWAVNLADGGGDYGTFPPTGSPFTYPPFIYRAGDRVTISARNFGTPDVVVTYVDIAVTAWAVSF